MHVMIIHECMHGKAWYRWSSQGLKLATVELTTISLFSCMNNGKEVGQSQTITQASSRLL